MTASKPSSISEAEPPRAISQEQDALFFSGTATVVLRFAGFTLLTGPNFLHQGDHARLDYGLTATRRTEPALSVEQADALPLDAVLLSHLHVDRGGTFSLAPPR